MASPEDGSQKDETGCDTVAEAHYPVQVGSKPCSGYHSQKFGQKSREPAQVSQLTVTVPGIVGQYQTGDKIHLKELKNIILLHLARSGWKEGWRDCNWFPCREIHLRED